MNGSRSRLSIWTILRLTHGETLFNCVAWLDRTHDSTCELTFDTDEKLLAMDGCIHDGVDFRVKTVERYQGGQMWIIDGRKLLLEGVTYAVQFARRATFPSRYIVLASKP